MSEFKKNLSKIFKNSSIFTEQKKTEINEGTWDDIKKEWNKGKEIARAGGKHFTDKIADTIFNKKEPKMKVAGTGSPDRVAKEPKSDPNKTITIPPEKFGGNVNSPIKPSVAPVLVKPSIPKQEPIKPREIPQNDDAMIVDPKSGRNIVHPDKPIVILNPQGIELQGVEDVNQKEKKILNPIKNILKKKNSEFSNTFEKLKQKNGITSVNSTDEISQKDPTDPIRKTIIKDVFAIQFYNDAYKKLLKNLRDMNIITENKIDYGTFQQAINNALDSATEIHNRRYKLKRKKINNLLKNEKDVNFGLRKGKDMFSKDVNAIYTSNKDKFTQPLLQEGVKYFYGFLKEEYISEEDAPKEDTSKEDKIIRPNDYVWWLDANKLVTVLDDEKSRNLLTYKNSPIEFQKMDSGKYVDGTAAQIKFLMGAQKGETEKIDIRNINIPQKVANDLVQFGKVIGAGDDIDAKIAKNKEKLDDANAMQNTGGISDKTKAEHEKTINDLKKEEEKLQKQKENGDSIGDVAKIQKFNAKDPGSIAKTIAGGKTKITPDPSNEVLKVNSNQLVKLNSEGKKSLLKIIGVSSIVLHSIWNIVSGDAISSALNKVNSKLAGIAKNFGDMAGSKSETNF